MKRIQLLLISSIMLCAPACACPPSVAPHVNVDVQLSGDKTDDTNATTSPDVSEPDLGGTPTTGNVSEPGAKITGNVSEPSADGKATGINITVKSPNFPTSPTASPPK